MCLFILLILFLPVTAPAMTADDVRALDEIWRTREAVRKKRIQTRNLKKLIPEQPPESPITTQKEGREKSKASENKVIPDEGENKKITPPTSTKYKTETAQQPEISLIPKAHASPLPRVLSPWFFKQGKDGIYIAPPRQGGFDPLTDATTRDHTRIFGIRIGTWMKGELKRSASNAEPGLIEIYTTESVSGKKRTLPAGTILFARKAYNVGTKKLDLIVEKGITPNGLELEMKGLVFDLQQTAGLIGIISTDSEMIVERSTSKGMIAAGGAVAGQLAEGTVFGSAGSAAAESLIEDSSNAVERSKTLKQTIRSAPQKLLIRIEETF